MFSSKGLKRVAIYLTVKTIVSSISFTLVPGAVAQSTNVNRTKLLQRQVNRQCSMPVYAQITGDSAVNTILQRLNSASTASDSSAQRLGNDYLSIGRYGEAVQAYQRSVLYTISQRLFGSSGQTEIGAYSGVGNAYLGLGGYQKAEAAYLKMLDAHVSRGMPMTPGSYRYTQLGNALLPQGRLDEAGAAYRKGLVLEHGSFDRENLRINQANLEFFTKGPATVVSTYKEALPAQKSFFLNDVVALNNLGLAYQAIGQLEQADESYTAAVKVFSKAGTNAVFSCQWQTYSNYGRLLAQQGKTDEAIGYYRRATDLTNRIWQTSLPTLAQDDKQAYRQMVGPIYQEFTVLLLKRGRFNEAIQLMSTLYAPGS